jgi:hypothetical protein
MSRTSTNDEAVYASELARDNGAPEWLAIVILIFFTICFCILQCANDSHQQTNSRFKSALDQEAVSFIEPEAT